MYRLTLRKILHLQLLVFAYLPLFSLAFVLYFTLVQVNWIQVRSRHMDLTQIAMQFLDSRIQSYLHDSTELSQQLQNSQVLNPSLLKDFRTHHDQCLNIFLEEPTSPMVSSGPSLSIHAMGQLYIRTAAKISSPSNAPMTTVVTQWSMKNDLVQLQQLLPGKTTRLLLITDNPKATMILNNRHLEILPKNIIDSQLPAHAINQEYQTKNFMLSDQKHLFCQVPIFSENNKQALGRLAIIQEEREAFAPILFVKIGFYLAIILLFLILLFLNRYMVNYILNPLEILLDGTKKTAAGNLTVKTDIRSADEFGLLSRNFDQMVTNLARLHHQLEKDKKTLQMQKEQLTKTIEDKELAEAALKELNRNLESRVTERTHEIVALKKFHEEILQSISTGILVFDGQTCLQFINPTAEQLLKKQGKESLHKHLTELSLPDTMARLIQNALLENRGFSSTEFEVVIESRVRTFGMKASLLMENNYRYGLVIVFNDISDRKRMETELLQTEKMMSLAILSSGMAHDINNLLNRIQIITQCLQKEGHIPMDLSEDMKLAITEGKQLTCSLESLSRNQEIELSQVDLAVFFTKFLTQNKIRLQAQDISLSLSCPEKVSIPAASHFLNQICQNLLRNAVEAFEGQPGKISIEVIRQEKQVSIHFTDNGPGIDPANQHQLFHPFFTTKMQTPSGGWGIGLTLVKNLVDAMHGRIEVHSEPGKGSTFRLLFHTTQENNP